MIRSPHEVEVNGQVLTTKNIVVATGARPFVPPTPGLEDVQFSHSGNIWDLRKQPKHLAVIGGGPIGLELAQAFRRLGSEVTIINLDPGILPREDLDMVQFIRESFENDGIKLLDETTIESIEKRGNSSRIHYSREDEKHFLDVDHILMAVGRTPNSSGFGLENLGAELNKNKTIKVDKFLRSSIPNIYACGDVAGPYQFTHMAGHQAWYATVNALFSPLKKFAVDYSAVPWCTYTDPELARGGLSEDEAKAQNIPHEVTTYGLEDLDRAITDRTDFGKVKVITPPGKDKILGAAICGVHAGDLLAEFTLAMKHGIGLNKILGTIHPYPTLSEASKMLAGVWRKNHSPAIVLHFLERFHSWRR
jgi:pyruvate/2-oxoglutarate dehydrogenase complex dihydrolipoamide dehydrogenase (E3) component